MPNIKALPGLGDDYVSQVRTQEYLRVAADIIVLHWRYRILRCCTSAERIQRSWSTEEDDDFEGSGPLDRPLLLGEVGLR
jgi:hypothetical protein